MHQGNGNTGQVDKPDGNSVESGPPWFAGSARYGDTTQEYTILSDGLALVARADRAALEIGGEDRASWLHNFTTHHVKTLGPGDGTYAFATSAQGRILFDLNMLVRPDAIWIDLDRRHLAVAQAHFDKFIIVEDVSVRLINDRVRLGLCGKGAVAIVERFGAKHAPAMADPSLTEITWEGVRMPLVRRDFCGTFGVELFVPQKDASAVWHSLIELAGAVPVGNEAVELRRIEAGIPRAGFEITPDVLPAETGLFDRAVSFQKGCYLGQEIVERMRTRGGVARGLAGLQFAGKGLPPPGAALLTEDEKPVGRVTSACRSPAWRASIGLGYVKTSHDAVGTALRTVWADGEVEAAVVALPHRAHAQG